MLTFHGTQLPLQKFLALYQGESTPVSKSPLTNSSVANAELAIKISRAKTIFFTSPPPCHAAQHGRINVAPTAAPQAGRVVRCADAAPTKEKPSSRANAPQYSSASLRKTKTPEHSAPAWLVRRSVYRPSLRRRPAAAASTPLPSIRKVPGSGTPLSTRYPVIVLLNRFHGPLLLPNWLNAPLPVWS